MGHRATRHLITIGIMLIVTGLVFGSAGPVSAVVWCKSPWSSHVKARYGWCGWGEKEILSCAEDQIARYVGGQWVCSDDGAASLICTKATVDLDSAIPTMTIYGQFCDNPDVRLGQNDGTFQLVQILAAGANFITTNLTGNTDPATVRTLVECPESMCEMDVAVVPPTATDCYAVNPCGVAVCAIQSFTGE